MTRLRTVLHRQGYFTLYELAQRWDCTTMSVRKRLKAGKLGYEKIKGVFYIPAEEVRWAEAVGLRPGRYGRQTNGQRTAEAVRMFREGRNVADVVVDLHMTFDEATDLYNAYKRLGGDD